MKGYAKANIMGNLTADPEVREITTGAGEKVNKVEFSIAVSGRHEDDVMFLRCEAWGKLGEIITMAKKGEPVFIEAQIDQHNYEDDAGNKRVITRYRAREFRFLGSKGQEVT